MSTTIIGHNDEIIASLVVLVLTLLCLYCSCLCCLRLCQSIVNYIFPSVGTTLPTVSVIVARFPANGQAPSLIRLVTTNKSLIQGTDVFPSHIPDVWTLWDLPENMSTYRGWETTQLKNQPFEACNGIYMTIYSFAPHLQENYHVPKILQPSSRMLGDVFVAKLDRSHCGRHGRAVYEDINLQFLQLPCVTEKRQ